MAIRLERVYDESGSGDYRVLVDRIWPRGISKESLAADEWLREIAPSSKLRKAFHSGDVSWDEFRRSYLTELKDHRDTLRPLAERASRESVTLLYSAKDDEHNNAVVLKQYLSMLE
ncbi:MULTISPECIES: DUF488 domain-containing protein [Marinobacter]|uniref:Uncharacterized conserved protein YeaO, DUF488 family n=1 Tax=Marinobacter segnicrescens TaxID=430453 RepID=A0A1I0CAD2_9GAMM|nr:MULTISPECIES: DUF488 family protein [Marinobacter]UZD64889.1 DUF488 family protein [Marinobacter sp. AN1]SET16520.1 Uncharacterized conserved protein YeaO, DUF488 family [Marinobacter segnicrescens]